MKAALQRIPRKLLLIIAILLIPLVIWAVIPNGNKLINFTKNSVVRVSVELDFSTYDHTYFQGQEILIDGKKTGKRIPSDIKVSDGSHNIQVLSKDRDLYSTFSQEIDVRENIEVKISPKVLEKASLKAQVLTDVIEYFEEPPSNVESENKSTGRIVKNEIVLVTKNCIEPKKDELWCEAKKQSNAKESFWLKYDPNKFKNLTGLVAYKDFKRKFPEGKIIVRGLFFAASDSIGTSEEHASLVKKILASMESFHKKEFKGQSKIEYQVFDKDLKDKKHNKAFFESIEKGGGGEYSSIDEAITTEIKSLKIETMDSFLKPNDEYFTVVIIFTDIGFTSHPSISPLNSLSYVFASTSTHPYPEALAYHEFGHLFGFPDQYHKDESLSDGRLVTPCEKKYGERGIYCIMQGSGTVPLEQSFIDVDLLKMIGVKI